MSAKVPALTRCESLGMLDRLPKYLQLELNNSNNKDYFYDDDTSRIFWGLT